MRNAEQPDLNHARLKQSNGGTTPQRKLSFPDPEPDPSHIVTQKKSSSQTRSLFTKTPGGNDNYYADARELEGRWAPAFKLGPRKSTLGNLPEDESNFPVSTWFKQLLSVGVERIVLDSQRIRKNQQAAAPLHVTYDEERAVAAWTPVLDSYFESVGQTPNLISIFWRVVSLPSMWS